MKVTYFLFIGYLLIPTEIVGHMYYININFMKILLDNFQKLFSQFMLPVAAEMFHWPSYFTSM